MTKNRSRSNKSISTNNSVSLSSHIGSTATEMMFVNGRQLPPGHLVLSHNGTFYQTWWYIVALSAVTTGIFTPLALAFYPHIRYAEIPLDCVFYVDIILTFFVSIQLHGWTITNNNAIALEYLSFWFWFDLLAVIPFEFMVPEDSHASFLRLFRLIRLRRLFPLFTKAEKNQFCNFTLISVSKYFTMAFYYGHVSACIFFELARIDDFRSSTWVSICSPGLQNRPVSVQYLTSIYWAFTTLTTVGYGDISPQADSERVWGTIYMVINLGLNAYILGNMTALASKPDSETHQFRQQLDDVSVFMKQNNIPIALRAQVIQFMQLQYKMKTTKGNEMVNNLPSAIKMPIKKHQYKEILEGIDIFRGVSKPFLDMLMANVEEEIFMEGMHIINNGDLGSSFYIITEGECGFMVSPLAHGQVKMDIGETKCATIEPGSHFGAEGYFASCNQAFSIRVQQLCVAIKIDLKVRREMVAQYPRDLQVVVINMRRRLEIMIDMISQGLEQQEKRERMTGAGHGVDGNNNFLPGGVNEKKSALKLKRIEDYDYKPRKSSRRGRSMRTLTNFTIIHNSTHFLRAVHEVRQQVKLFMERHEQDIAANLCQLASVGDHQNLRQMLYGLDLSGDTGDYDGRVPLHLACSRGHLEACKVLLKYKADPSHTDNFGVTPLQECVNGGHDEVIAFMVRKDAKLKLLDEGARMCQVCNDGDIKELSRLLKARVDPNACDYDTRTGLHLAACGGNFAVCKLLLRHGADPTLKDRWGITPIDEANRTNNDAIETLCKEHSQRMETKKQFHERAPRSTRTARNNLRTPRSRSSSRTSRSGARTPRSGARTPRAAILYSNNPTMSVASFRDAHRKVTTENDEGRGEAQQRRSQPSSKDIKTTKKDDASSLNSNKTATVNKVDDPATKTSIRSSKKPEAAESSAIPSAKEKQVGSKKAGKVKTTTVVGGKIPSLPVESDEPVPNRNGSQNIGRSSKRNKTSKVVPLNVPETTQDGSASPIPLASPNDIEMKRLLSK